MSTIGLVNPYQVQLPPSATWDPTSKGAAVVLSLANTKADATASNDNVRSTTSKSSDKVSFEGLVSGAGVCVFGICNASKSLNVRLSLDADGIGYQSSGGAIVENGVSLGFFGAYTAGDRIHFDIDVPNSLLYVAKNGVYGGSMDPSAGTGGVAWAFSGAVYICASPGIIAGTTGIALATSGLVDPLPTGYSAWG